MHKYTKSLLFVSDRSPNNKMASSVVFHRHLSFLENEGWDINLLLTDSDRNNYEGKPSWNTLFLPSREWFYPPFRPYGILSKVRYKILEYRSSAFINLVAPNVIIGYLRGTYFTGLSAHLASAYNIPLGYLYHDATEYFPDMYGNEYLKKKFIKYKKKLIEKSAAVWAVSESMIEDEGHNSKLKLLYPLPEDIKQSFHPVWKPEFMDNPVIFHAGTVYREIVDPLIHVAKALSLMGGRLVLMTASGECARIVAEACPETVRVESPKPTAVEAVAHVSKNASAMIVAYPEHVNDMPWIKTCFPSKLPQFMASGLPTLLLAPEGSALSFWAKKHDYEGVIKLDQPEEMKLQILDFMDERAWNKGAFQSRDLWSGMFNPEEIHRTFLSGLMDIAK